MAFIKKNQIIIYTLALMLVTAGYLNYTSNIKDNSIETSFQEETVDNTFKEGLVENNNDVNGTENKANVTNTTSNTNIQVNSENIKKNDEVADVGDATLVNSDDVVTNYFAKSKLERDSMYSQMLETYEKILNSNTSLETQKQSATQEIKKINETKNSIMICENLIKTKGFEDCVIFVNGKSISVIIGAKSLKKEEIAQIQNIISRELDVKIENIHISTK